MIATDQHRIEAVWLLDALDRIGEPDAIAAYLYVEDCKGVPLDPRSCPVALWLDRQLDGPPVVVIGSYFYVGEDPNESQPVPHNVHRFVQRFDANAYPELVAESSC